MGRKYHYLRRARERRPTGDRGGGGGGKGKIFDPTAKLRWTTWTTETPAV
jgi:hypothetical protein